MAESSFTMRRKKSPPVMGRIGVPLTGDALARRTSVRPLRGAVDGTKVPVLEGGIISSVLGNSPVSTASSFAANGFLKRLFAGVAFTCTFEEVEFRKGFFGSTDKC